jgi:hypothetical protein
MGMQVPLLNVALSKAVRGLDLEMDDGPRRREGINDLL